MMKWTQIFILLSLVGLFAGESWCQPAQPRERRLSVRNEQPVQSPSWIEAKGTSKGAVVSWRFEQTPQRGVYVYRDGQKLTDLPIKDGLEGQYLDEPLDETATYQVTSVNYDWVESPKSIPVICHAGSADKNPPQIVVISPPLSVAGNQPVDIKARLMDGRSSNKLSTDKLIEFSLSIFWQSAANDCHGLQNKGNSSAYKSLSWSFA